MKILAATSLYQTPDVFRAVSETWKKVRGIDQWLAFDDHSPQATVDLAWSFMAVTSSGEPERSAYVRNDAGHLWELKTLERMSRIRNRILEEAALLGADVLLMVDSDVALAPNTVEVVMRYWHLCADPFAAISPIYWTCGWDMNNPEKEFPQVWDYHPYQHRGVQQARFAELRKPGMHKVNGLGAVTFIPMRVFTEPRFNISYQPIESLTRIGGMMSGEDRSFCIRAETHGLNLFGLATDPPLAYHVYRECDLGERFAKWWAEVSVAETWERKQAQALEVRES